jgi:hypothetical protein
LNPPEQTSVTPFKRMDGEPVFDEAWQAQLLAMVDQMIVNSVFSNALWSDTLGQNLKAAESRGEADDIDTYYAAVLSSFETLLTQSSDVSKDTITDKQQAWERAYLSTPHGQPVVLKD